MNFKPVLLGVLLTAGVQAAEAPAGRYDYQPIPGVAPEPLRAAPGLQSREDLEAFLDGVLNAQLREHHIAGATIAVVKDGRLFFSKGYGYADLAKRTPVDPARTLFRPGSTSKLFTWTALMQQVEQGKVALDADVNTYLSQFKLPQSFPDPITVRNLMTHTPGLEDGGIGYLFARDEKSMLPLAKTLGLHVPARIRPPTTDFTNGTVASYSNWGAALAGLIVANVSGQDFDEYVEQHILQPLGMQHSTFREPLPAVLAPDMSVGYTYAQGAFKPHGFEWIHPFGPAGGLSATAEDMAKFMLAHLNHGAYGEARILKEETAKLMHARTLSPNPHVNGSALGFYETYVNGYRTIEHGGDTLYFHSLLSLVPELNLGLFVSYNSAGNLPIDNRGDLLRQLMRRYYPAKLPELKPPADFAKRAAQYAGSYSDNRHSYTKNEKLLMLAGGIHVAPTKENTLLITGLGEADGSQWVEAAPDVFRKLDDDEVIAFVRDAHGDVTNLITPFAFIAAYKLRWWETPAFHYGVFGFAVLCFVVAIVSALRNWKQDRAADPQARRARRLAALVALLDLGFLVGAGLSIAAVGDFDKLLYGLPMGFKLALALPLAGLPLTALLLYFAVAVWRKRLWSAFARAQYGLIVLASVVFLWSLNYWNLLGYKFG